MHEHTALFESRGVSYSARDANKLGHGIALSQHLVPTGRKLTVHALFCLTPTTDWIVVCELLHLVSTHWDMANELFHLVFTDWGVVTHLFHLVSKDCGRGMCTAPLVSKDFGRGM